MEIGYRIVDEVALSTLYRPPATRAAQKVRTRLDEASARFVDLCPFLVLATTDGTRVDASPRGGPPGFIQRLDERHVAIPDLGGNNRLDSFRNILAHPWAGLLLIVPGKDETLRINGPAILTTDPSVLDGFTTDLRRPKVAVVVETAEVFGHCAKAFRRSRLWDSDWWPEIGDAPDLAALYAAQFDGVEESEMRTTLAELYTEDLADDQP